MIAQVEAARITAGAILTARHSLIGCVGESEMVSTSIAAIVPQLSPRSQTRLDATCGNLRWAGALLSMSCWRLAATPGRQGAAGEASAITTLHGRTGAQLSTTC